MHLLEYIERATQDECREIGNLFLALADSPRDAAFAADIRIALAHFQSPEERGRAQLIEAGRARVASLNAGLLADGTNHRKLLAAELARRGDPRSVEEYSLDVAGGAPHSDVIYSDFAR